MSATINENVGKWGRWMHSSGLGTFRGIAEQSHKGTLTACGKGRGHPARVALRPYGDSCAECLSIAALRSRFDPSLDTAEVAA